MSCSSLDNVFHCTVWKNQMINGQIYWPFMFSTLAVKKWLPFELICAVYIVTFNSWPCNSLVQIWICQKIKCNPPSLGLLGWAGCIINYVTDVPKNWELVLEYIFTISSESSMCNLMTSRFFSEQKISFCIYGQEVHLGSHCYRWILKGCLINNMASQPQHSSEPG